MIKKTLLLTILIFTIFNIQSQNIEKRKLLANKYLSLVSAKQQIDTSLLKTEDSIFAQINAYFNKHNLDVNIKNDVENFKFHVHTQIDFIKRTVYNRLVYNYTKSDYKKLKKNIKMMSKKGVTDVKQLSTYQTQQQNLINRELTELFDVFIPDYLDKLFNKHIGIKLKILVNNQTIDADSLDIDIYVLHKDTNKKKRLINKQKSVLKKPAGCKYDDISSLIIKYKGLKFKFAPDEKIYRLPHNLGEMKNPISKYSFEKIPEWEIKISEDKKTISITLINVEEFTTTLNK